MAYFGSSVEQGFDISEGMLQRPEDKFASESKDKQKKKTERKKIKEKEKLASSIHFNQIVIRLCCPPLGCVFSLLEI